jgi:hypothetical protein
MPLIEQAGFAKALPTKNRVGEDETPAPCLLEMAREAPKAAIAWPQ